VELHEGWNSWRHEASLVTLGDDGEREVEVFEYDGRLDNLIDALNAVSCTRLYRTDRQQRLEFDAPRAYRQRPMTAQDVQTNPGLFSDDGWVDEHLEIVDAEEDATIADLFEAE